MTRREERSVSDGVDTRATSNDASAENYLTRLELQNWPISSLLLLDAFANANAPSSERLEIISILKLQHVAEFVLGSAGDGVPIEE